MSDEEVKQLIASNAKAIAALTALHNEIFSRVAQMQGQIAQLTRQSIERGRRTDNNTADFENWLAKIQAR